MSEETSTTEQAINYKVCTKCKQKKLKTLFCMKSAAKDKLNSWCKKCKDARQIYTYSHNAVAFVRRLYHLATWRYRKLKHHEVLISQSEFIDIWKEQHDRFGLRCPYSGVEMTFLRGVGRTLYNISVDRIDSKKPYIDGNIVFCSAIVNRMKQELSLRDFIMICKTISCNNMIEHLTP